MMRIVSVALVLMTTGAMATAQDFVTGPTVYGRAEALFWRVQDAPLPHPLLTMTAAPVIGTTGSPGTSVLLGGSAIDLGTQPGARVTAGIWLDESASFGVEASAFYLNRFNSSQSFADPTGASRFGYQYMNAVTGQAAVLPLSGPGFFTPDQLIFVPQQEAFVLIPGVRIPGRTATVRLDTDSQLCGVDANCMAAICIGKCRAEGLAGFRYLQLEENMTLEASSLTNPSIPGEIFTMTDTFSTRNNFYGGQVGARLVYNEGCLFGELCGKLAGGVMLQQVETAGQLQTTTGTFPSGVYAQRTNSGTGNAERFACVSEVQANAGVQFGCARIFAGYSILYINSVVRPGNQIDPFINPNQSEAILAPANPPGIGGGPAAPSAQINPSSFWAQGISLGLELRY
jgi:hypothetical protein